MLFSESNMITTPLNQSVTVYTVPIAQGITNNAQNIANSAEI